MKKRLPYGKVNPFPMMLNWQRHEMDTVLRLLTILANWKMRALLITTHRRFLSMTGLLPTREICGYCLKYVTQKKYINYFFCLMGTDGLWTRN